MIKSNIIQLASDHRDKMAQKHHCSIFDYFEKKRNCTTDSSEIVAEKNIVFQSENNGLCIVANRFFYH